MNEMNKNEQNALMSFLLPNNFYMSSEITGKILAGRLFIKVTESPIFNLSYHQFLIAVGQIPKMLLLNYVN